MSGRGGSARMIVQKRWQRQAILGLWMTRAPVHVGAEREGSTRALVPAALNAAGPWHR